MADVTAALVTFNEIAICGSEGSKMLVARVPMAARTERTAIGSALEILTLGRADSIASHWSAIELSGCRDRRGMQATPRVPPDRFLGVCPFSPEDRPSPNAGG